MPPAVKSDTDKADKATETAQPAPTQPAPAATPVDPAAHQAALDEVARLREQLAKEREDASDFIRSLEAKGTASSPRRPAGLLRTYRAVHTLRFLRDGEEVEVPAGDAFRATPDHLKGLRPGSFRTSDE